jgi:hypothetical protein
VSDPIVEAARDIIEDSLSAFRATIAGLGADALNWLAAGPETNPIAVLAAHAMGSTRWWLSAAAGASLPERDRDAEFRVVANDPNEVLRSFDAIARDCRTLLEVDAFDPAAARVVPDEVVTAAWALLHATEHLREHLAHAQLTRQAWEQQRPDARSPG